MPFEGLKNLVALAQEEMPREKSLPEGVTLEDFWAYMVAHNYIYAPTGQSWPASSVNAKIPPLGG